MYFTLYIQEHLLWGVHKPQQIVIGVLGTNKVRNPYNFSQGHAPARININ